MSPFYSMTQATFHFDALTPDLIWYALESIGIRAESGFLPLNSYENRVYQFTDEERRRFVVKFYRPQRWTDEQIQEEHDFALELEQEEIPIVRRLDSMARHYTTTKATVLPCLPAWAVANTKWIMRNT